MSEQSLGQESKETATRLLPPGVQHSKVGEFREDFALLIELGFIAVKQLDEICATRLFNAAQALSPSSTAPQVGLGFIALNKLEVKRAIEIFERILLVEKENHLAQTFLGICYMLNKTKRKKGEKLIKEAISKTSDPTVKELGKTSLEWAEKDLKKEEAPFFMQGTEAGEKETDETKS